MTSSDNQDVIGLLADRSGSMAAVVKQAKDGMNGFIGNMQGDPAGQNSLFMLSTFDSMGFDLLRRGIMSGIEKLKDGEFKPRALTPLIDAAHWSILEMAKLGNGRKILAILTDGLENASKKHTKKELKALIEAKRAEGWIIIYLGANFDAWQEAEAIGIPKEFAMNFRANGHVAQNAPKPGLLQRVGLQAQQNPIGFALAAAAAVGFAAWALSSSNAHATQPQGFTDEQRNAAMGVTDNWQEAVQHDIATFQEPFNSVFDLPPDLIEAMRYDRDPELGSWDQNGEQPGVIEGEVLSAEEVPSGDRYEAPEQAEHDRAFAHAGGDGHHRGEPAVVEADDPGPDTGGNDASSDGE